MQDQVLLYKLVIAILCGAGYLVLNAIPALATMPRRRFDAGLALLWTLTRLGLFYIAYFPLHMPATNDVAEFYYPPGRDAMHGLMVYRDFSTPYAPAFPYLVALILLVWDSTKAIVLASVVMDGLGLIVWLKVMRRLWNESEVRRFAIFYVLGAQLILDVALGGHTQSWIALLLGLAVWLHQKGKPVWAALVASSGMVLVKLLAALEIAAFLRRRPRFFQTATAAMALPAIVYGGLLAMGVDVLLPVKLQGVALTSGNIPYLLSGLVRHHQGLFQAGSALILLALAIYLLTRPEPLTAEQIVWTLVILTLTCGLANKKFTTNYLAMIYAPLCAVAVMDGARGVYRFAIFNIVASVELSIWFRWLSGTETTELWQVIERTSKAADVWRLAGFLLVEVTLLGFYGYYLSRAWKLLHACFDRSRSASQPHPVEVCR